RRRAAAEPEQPVERSPCPGHVSLMQLGNDQPVPQFVHRDHQSIRADQRQETIARSRGLGKIPGYQTVTELHDIPNLRGRMVPIHETIQFGIELRVHEPRGPRIAEAPVNWDVWLQQAGRVEYLRNA